MKNFEWFFDRYEISSIIKGRDFARLVRAVVPPLRVRIRTLTDRRCVGHLRDSRNFDGRGNGYIVATFSLEPDDDLDYLTEALNHAFLLKYRSVL